MAATAEHLTDPSYWDAVWKEKGVRRWADLRWVYGRYNLYVWDRLLQARLRTKPGRRLLEVGCAGGKWLVYFQKVFDYEVTGCDYSETGSATARANLEAAGISARVLQQDLFTLTGEFDVVYSYGLIEHFDDPSLVLEKFTSLLPPEGGTLVSLVPNLSGLSGFYHKCLKPETFDTHRIVTFAELQQWYAALGLQHIEVGALGSFVPFMFPRDKIRQKYPRFYRLFWGGCLGPLTWISNRLCLALFKRFGVRLESPRFSPYLYAIGERRSAINALEKASSQGVKGQI